MIKTLKKHANLPDFARAGIMMLVLGLIITTTHNQLTQTLARMNASQLAAAPFHEFFIYHRIEPEKSAFTSSDQLRFKSYMETFTPLQFTYIDVLRCDKNPEDDIEEFQRVGEWISTEVHTGPRDFTEGTGFWPYRGDLPTQAAVCYIEANVIAEVAPDVLKVQEIESERFVYSVEDIDNF
jgi:hypothetical protein